VTDQAAPADAVDTWHFYDQASGLFSGAWFRGTAAELQAQLQHKGPGVGAWRGEVDYLSQRLDMATGALVDYKPDPPWDGTDLTLYVWWWNAAIKRWALRPRLKKLKADKWAEIKAVRDAATDAPLPTEHGTFDHDAKARQALLEIATGASVTSADVVATLADDTTVSLTPRQMAAVYALSHHRVQMHRETATALRAEIDAAGNAAAVAAIAWPGAPG